MNKNYSTRRVFFGKAATVLAGTALLSSQISLGAILNDQAPFEGYNPFAEETNDLRTDLFSTNSIEVTGKIYTSNGINTIPNAKIEVWHLSPNSKKYRHRGKLTSDSEGKYTFHTDFPNRGEGEKPRIFFKTTTNNKTSFTELIFDSNHAYISSTQWESNKNLKNKLFPKYKKTILGTNIQFNYTI